MALVCMAVSEVNQSLKIAEILFQHLQTKGVLMLALEILAESYFH